MVSTPSAEVKLLKDDNWKLIQQNTFTRWVNQHLKKQADIGGPQVDNLENDFADGICLIKLAEVLSGKPLPRYNKKPTMRTQKLDNVSLVLNFFQNKEGIKIVNIDSSHIVDRNLKLILGLVWTLILHYSLSHRQINLEDENGANQAEEQEKKETPKKRLLAWIQSKLPKHSIKNFTSNWNDGIALGALVDACLGGRFEEWQNWNPTDGLENTQKAMQTAEQALGIETLITPEELTNPNVDEKSVMTYLAQFPRAKPKMIGQIGEDIDRHPFMGIPTKFTIELDDQQNYQPELAIFDPFGEEIETKMIPDIQHGKYQIEFVPTVVGEYKINLSAKENAATGLIPIESTTIQAIPSPQIHGLDQSIHSIGNHHRFQIKNVLDYQKLDVRAIDPNGKEILLDSNSERDAETITCCYTPKMEGTHQIDIQYDGRPVPGNPFEFEVTKNEEENTTNPNPLLAYKNALIWGRGILPKGTGAEEEMAVNVDNCSEPVKIAVVKENKLIPHSIRQNLHQPIGTVHPRQSFIYTPPTSGIYEVTVMTKNGDLLLGKSPYKVNVGPKNSSPIRADGPGLEGGIAGEEAIFYVDTYGKTDQLEFAIEGPSETQIYCTDGGNGTAIVKYTPKDPGCYTIKILELDTSKFIKNSPFVIWVDPPANSHSPHFGRNKSGGNKFINEPIPINFDEPSHHFAGNGPPLRFTASPTPTKLLHRHPELVSHELPTFTPNHQKKMPSFNGDAKMVEVSGRGLETFVPGQPAEFMVDTSNTGLNKLFIAVITSNGQTDELNIRHIGGNEYLVSYLVPYNAQAQIHIKYGDSNVPGSPFCVNPSTQIQNNGNGNGKDHYFSI